MARIPDEQLIPRRYNLSAVSADGLYRTVGVLNQQHGRLAPQVTSPGAQVLSADPGVAYDASMRTLAVVMLRCLKAPNAAPLRERLGIDVAVLERDLQVHKNGWAGFRGLQRIELGAEQCQRVVEASGWMGTVLVNQDVQRIAQGQPSKAEQKALKDYQVLQETDQPLQDAALAAKDQVQRVGQQTDEELAEIESQRAVLETMGKVRQGQTIDLGTLSEAAEIFERLQNKPQKQPPPKKAKAPPGDRRDRGRQVH